MTQQIHIGARLSPATTGTLIGYRIDNLDSTEYAAFTRTGVVELDVAGAWHVATAVNAPDPGCLVYWGVSGTDMLVEKYGPAVATADDLNALNVIPAAATGSSNVAGSLTIIKASTFETTITGVIAPSGWTKAYLTVKQEGQVTSADSTSVIQLLVTNPGNGSTDGLKILNGASGTLAGGSITINTDDDEVDVVLTDDTTSALTTGQYVYDIKFLYSTSKSGHIYTGILTVSATATQTYNTA
jgi:hypothetical protein